MVPTTIPTIETNDGTPLSAIGFGTYSLWGEAGAAAMTDAVECGYRLLDSAVRYENEGAVGEAVRRSGIAREDVVVTTKLPGGRYEYELALSTIEESLFRMRLERIDLYLLHWPNPRTDRYVEAWRALVEARRRGLVRLIGVCNFLPEHLDRIIADSGVAPSVNQIELHPYFPQAEQRRANAERGILTESWSPLGRGSELLSEPVITGIAERHGVAPGQVVLAWHVGLGVLPVPKAASHRRRIENLAIFDIRLSDDEIAAITALGRPDGRLRGQDPAVHEEF